MKIVKSSHLELDIIDKIVNDAKLRLKSMHIDQWQDGYPNREVIINDIKNGNAYIIKEGDEVIAYAAIIFDGEADYKSLYNGKWLSDEDYAVIHRICISEKYQGCGLAPQIFELIFDFVKAHGYHYLRIDTHPDNIIMRKLLTSLKFQIAGDIYLARGHSLRNAYDIIIK